MNELTRETATDCRDLPHAFDGPLPEGNCALCNTGRLDARHMAWERAREEHPANGTLPRVLGV